VIPASFDLHGRVALVTGAGSGSGIGFACARLLTELGAVVALAATSDRVHERVGELGGAPATGHIADLTDEAQARRVVEEVVVAHGRLDIVVANAGMTSVTDPGMPGSVVGTTADAWRAGIARNLDTAFHVLRAALPHLIAGGAGRVVAVTSVTGPVMAMRDEAAYAAAKAGLVGLMRSIAIDHASEGVTANAVAPGWIATGSQTPDEARLGRGVPVGRSATPEEVASAVVWLCTPGAAYVTGQCIVVDGGNSIAEQR